MSAPVTSDNMHYQSQNNGALAALLAQETEVPESVRDLLQAAYATNTRRAYQSDLRAFRKWGGDVPTIHLGSLSGCPHLTMGLPFSSKNKIFTSV